MDQNIIGDIISGDGTILPQRLHTFIEQNNQTYSFPELNNNDLRIKLWTALFRYLSNEQLVSIHVPCLQALRILSRDKTNLNDMLCVEWINTLLHQSGLQIPDELRQQESSLTDYNILIEAQKCLYNLVFNSKAAQIFCCNNGILEGIMKRILTYRDPNVPTNVKLYDIRTLFIITALHTEVRPKVLDELHGLTYLVETLDLILKEASGEQDKAILSDTQVELTCEILRVLFNITYKVINEEDEFRYLKLVAILHDLLLTPTQTSIKRSELQHDVINLLIQLPKSCFKELVTVIPNDQDIPKEMEYDGYNMEVIFILLTFLKARLNNEITVHGQFELLSPVLTVLLKCADSSRIMRKYLRYQILPPLRDVHNRPEQGFTLRNHFCRMLTTPVLELRDLATELLFVLCKENGARMIKYFGYGNAAGLFANRGLMGGRAESDSKYSSDEDSETEEYREFRHGINEVVGCYEPPNPDATAEMTEEQKEYEVMKLVHLMQDLTQKGVIQPCRVGEDGRPVPIEHVAQLQEELPRQQLHNNSKNS